MKNALKKTLCGIGSCAVVAGGLLYFRAHTEPSPLPVSEPPAAQSAVSEPESNSSTDPAKEDVETLIQDGENMSSSEVEELLEKIAAQEEKTKQEAYKAVFNAAGSEASAAASSSRPEGASSADTSTAAVSSSVVSQSQSISAAASQPQQDKCDAQIEALVAQLYQQQERYERELLEIIRQAHQEYVAYPEDQRSLILKVQVVLGKTNVLTAMEKDCDAEVNNICSQMTAILKANGRDTAIVREVKKTYTDKKAELKQELIRQTYSGGDGSGSAGHWLYDRLE